MEEQDITPGPALSRLQRRRALAARLVARGAGALDGHFGSRTAWAGRINRPYLDMGNTSWCIIGQLFGNYWTDDAWFLTERGSEYGFNVDPTNGVTFEDLRTAWLKILDES